MPKDWEKDYEIDRDDDEKEDRRSSSSDSGVRYGTVFDPKTESDPPIKGI